MASDVLRNALQTIKDTGAEGFEGLLRDAVARVAQRELSLSKSGQQDGGDAATTPSAGGPSILIEAKRYRDGTDFRDLEVKIVEAVARRPELDIFLVGATRDVPEQVRRELHRLGEQNGVGVLIIDWPHPSALVAPLAALCAMAPDVVTARLPTPDVKAALDAIRHDPDFLRADTALKAELLRPDLGWSHTRRRMAGWLREAFAEANSSFARLGGRYEMASPSESWVERPRLFSALDRWWSGPTGPLVLLGEEGLGKTSAVLSWWHHRAAQDGSPLPVPVFIQAKTIRYPSFDIDMAAVLAERTGLRGPDFWGRRLRLLLSEPTPRRQFLLIVDGLNEAWNFNAWREVLSHLYANPWRDRVGVVLTCRPARWREIERGLEGFEPAVTSEKVEPFDDQELRSLLSLHTRRLEDFADGLLPFLRIPRLCRLAIRHGDKLADSGDMTPERLIYEDWKDRLSRRSALGPFSDGQFKAFLANQGRKLRDQLATASDAPSPLGPTQTLKDLTRELGAEIEHKPETLEATLSEIVDGGWMVPVQGSETKVRLDPQRAPHALALALLHDLKECPPEAVEDRLAEFLEPLGEQDLTASLLRAAATAALTDRTVQSPVRRLLLRSWLHRQNLRKQDFDAFWRLIPLDPEQFIGLAEAEWLAGSSDHSVDDFLIKALANAAELWDSVAVRLEQWISKWLGTYWEDPKDRFLGRWRDDPEQAAKAAERRRRTRERVAAWGGLPPGEVPVLLFDDTCGECGPRIVSRLIGLLSFMEPARAVEPLVTWAASRALMGKAIEFDKVAWLVRLGHDGSAGMPSLKARIEALVASGNEVAEQAARFLLDALATPETDTVLPPAPPAEPWFTPDFKVRELEGSAMVGVVSADGRVVPATSEHPTRVLAGFSRYAIDPAADVDAAWTAVLRRWSNTVDPTKLRLSGGRSSEDHDLDAMVPALARWAPTDLADIVRRLYATAATRSGEPLNQLAFNLGKYFLVLGAAERDVVGRLGLEAITAPAVEAEAPGKQGQTREDDAAFDLVLGALAERSAAEQIAVFLSLPNGPSFYRRHRRILAVPSREDIGTVLQAIDAADRVEPVRDWLWYLIHAPAGEEPADLSGLAPLTCHEDESVRKLALKLVVETGNPPLLEAFARSGWAASQETNMEARGYGSIALCKAVERGLTDDVSDRIEPKALGYLAAREGSTIADMDRFAEMVRRHIADDLDPRPRSRSVFGFTLVLRRPVEKLVEARTAEVEAWLEPMLDDPDRHCRWAWMDDFPYIDLCSGLLKHGPAVGIRLWQSMNRSFRRQGVSNGSFASLPFAVDDAVAGITALRDEVLDQAKTDQALMDIACDVIRNKRTGWLLDRIGRDLGGNKAGDMARGLWMAGLLDASPEADMLWAGDLALPPARGWLADVHSRAKAAYQRNRWARHWLGAFADEPHRDRAFGFHQLFVKCADARALVWAPEEMESKWDRLAKPWQVHWSACWNDLKAGADRQATQNKPTLFGTKVPTDIQAPWAA